ncbi:type IV pilus assembly protein PilY1 [Steroidobacter denitrificans]|uniref:Type IV pilus assembly protein PilY1 n=1 Tax=Steroidobacter denitrificans TaxID=465721 RepID=A0A127FCI0_STEDE|nr:PilC/PilY family type IV pilus protein [Steroidobacter denitrificans]AMN47268.1 type IV pilus assembly protein PilY1 [Steroidobacter denitrificans]
MFKVQLKRMIKKAGWATVATGTVLLSGISVGAPLALQDVPIFLPQSVPPLNMIVLGRDHKLYYEAYNDASDLDGDGVLDIRYKPSIDYYGYFDSYKCYDYASDIFEPRSFTSNKQCSGQWSGDFLNYLTTSRIDALRKVLYGGFRSTDTSSDTILERSHIPQDAHSWGKEYTSIAVDGYDIRNYTPLDLPTSSRRHLFANTTILNDSQQRPRLRYLLNQTVRIWNWVSIEQPVAGNAIVTGVNSNDGKEIRTSVSPTERTVRVRVCVANLLEENCRQYANGNYKPIGLLQEFGENDSMYFGLLTGSYDNNLRGGVLRKNIQSISDEIKANDGTFITTGSSGIIRSINQLRITQFTQGDYTYSPGWPNAWITTRPPNNGEVQDWGNPVAEMMYESFRYFAGRTSAIFPVATNGTDKALGLPVVSWINPYNNPNANQYSCAKPFQTVVSDINPSYDTDEIPGTAFPNALYPTPSDDVGGLHAANLGQTIWNQEYGGPQNIFIGQSGANTDGAPTPKIVSSFGNIRGLAPEEPTKLGGYYSASVAYHGRTTNLGTLNSSAGDQNVNTFAVALASPLPRIEIPTNNGTITLVPFAKSVDDLGIDRTQGRFQPTNQIVDFYVESLTPTSGRFRVNFEDVEQGADHDMDAIAVYDYVVNGDGTVTVTVTSEYAAGGIIQHMGYIISGTTADGTYLVVRDVDTAAGNDVDYFLDTPPAFTGTPPAPSSGTGRWNDGQALPLNNARTFTSGSSAAATLLKDPLWYAAKWGGFDESHLAAGDRTHIPDEPSKWDADGDGVPDNYFLVTNALKLSEQLRKAFQDIMRRATSASAASINSGSISSDTRAYQALFNTGEWTGELLSYRLSEETGELIMPAQWRASQNLPEQNSRRIITANSDGSATAFRWNSLDTTRQNQLNSDATIGQNLVAYLRGSGTLEGTGASQFRARTSKLGDIVSSAPIFVGRPPFNYRDSLESAPYSAFRTALSTSPTARRHMVYVGANDGMLHAFDATTGIERFAFIPSPVFANLPLLAQQNYSHRFYVDGSPNMGDVFFDGQWRTVLVGGLNKGGQGIYALDITNPDSISEATPESLLLWEFTDEDDADLGYTYSQPAIVKVRAGANTWRWVAIFGNGYNNTTSDAHTSTTGQAALYIVDIETGALIKKINTNVGTSQDPTGANRPNGLATPAAVDLNGDSIVDYIYAGDLFGNLWKFDLTNIDENNWAIPYGTISAPEPLYIAGYDANKDGDLADAGEYTQPITVRPEVARGPHGIGMMVLFGTGKFFEHEDKELTPERRQTFYGIIDRNSGTSTDLIRGRNTLLEQEIIAEGQLDIDGESIDYRLTSDSQLLTHRGWYLDLVSPINGYQAEKQVSNPVVRDGRIIFTTMIPDPDPCAFGGGGWLMELDLLNGSRLNFPPFDLNRDGLFDEQDMIEHDGVLIPPSGIGSTEGIIQQPAIIDAREVQYKYTPGTSGNIQVTVENPGAGGHGRQSWRQIR